MSFALVRQTVAYFGARIGPAIIGVLAVYLYTRLLEPSVVGTYALLSSIALFSAVAFNWVRVAMLRSLGSADEVGNDFARTVVVSFIATALIIAPVEAIGLTLFARQIPLTLVLLTIAASIATGWFELNLTFLQSRRRVGMYGAMNVSRAIATLAFTLLLIWAGAGSAALLGGFVLGNCSALITARAWAPALHGVFDRALAKRLLSFGWPQTVTGALAQFSTTFDRVLLGVAAGTGAVGIYAVAFDFSRQTVFLLIAATALAGQPMAIRLLDVEGFAAAREQLRHNVRLLLGVALPSVAGLVMLSGPLSRTLFGAHFRADAGFTIGLIAAATALYGMRVFYFDQAFELARRTGPQAVIGGIAAGVGAVCSLVLIPRLGALGAAYSALTSNAVGVAVSILWGWKVFRMPLAAGIWLRTGAATIGMVAVIAFVPLRSGFLGLGLDIAAAALAYGACYSLAYVAPRTLVSRLRSLAAR